MQIVEAPPAEAKRCWSGTMGAAAAAAGGAGGCGNLKLYLPLRVERLFAARLLVAPFPLASTRRMYAPTCTYCLLGAYLFIRAASRTEHARARAVKMTGIIRAHFLRTVNAIKISR